MTAERGWKARDEFTNASPKDERRVRDDRVWLNGCVGAQEVSGGEGGIVSQSFPCSGQLTFTSNM